MEWMQAKSQRKDWRERARKLSAIFWENTYIEIYDESGKNRMMNAV
jgi:hypothetical protein